MIKAIIFDCFGVLITDSLGEIVSELKKDNPDKADHIVKLVNAASKGAMDATASRSAVAGELGLTLDEYINAIRNGEVKNKPLLDYIKELRGRYKTALLSNIISGGLEVRFPDNELLQYFEVVVASGDIGFAKPEAQAYEITAEKLGVRLEECIMIDDSEDYCQGAKGVGMQSVLYQSFEQAKRDLSNLLL
jgi:HAD superfamily hydrolase (TIGR01509 family)